MSDAVRTTPEVPQFRYNAALANEIEAKWQARWEADDTFSAPNPVGPLSGGFADVAHRRKLYVLDMFPYPSGSGLHVGHPLGYIGTDVYARFMRMQRHNVLHAMALADALEVHAHSVDPRGFGAQREVRRVRPEREREVAGRLARLAHASKLYGISGVSRGSRHSSGSS